MTYSIKLDDGAAENMGEGVIVITQRDEAGQPQNVVVTREDLLRLLDPQG